MPHVLATELLEERDLDGPGNDGDRVEQAASAVAQTGRTRKDGIANGRRDVSAVSGEHFRDEERVPARRLVEPSSRPFGAAGELLDCFDRERRE